MHGCEHIWEVKYALESGNEAARNSSLICARPRTVKPSGWKKPLKGPHIIIKWDQINGGQRNCSGITHVWLTTTRCKQTVWLQNCSQNCIPTQTGKRWQLFAIKTNAQQPQTIGRGSAYTNTHEYMNMFAKFTHNAAGCRRMWRLECIYLGTDSFYLMFNMGAHCTPTAILSSKELLPNNINILKRPLFSVIIIS